MTAALVAGVLEEWRRAERLADALSPDSSDRRALHAVVEELRMVYAELTESTGPSAELAIRAQATLDEAISVLNAIVARRASAAAPPG